MYFVVHLLAVKWMKKNLKSEEQVFKEKQIYGVYKRFIPR